MLLEKLKEKNAAVPKAVSEALSLMHQHCWRLMDVSEDLAGERAWTRECRRMALDKR